LFHKASSSLVSDHLLAAPAHGIDQGIVVAATFMKTDRSRRSGSMPRQSKSSALDSAFRILTRRDHTRRELARKLRQKGFARAAVEGALDRCLELGYLDDAKTALTLAGHLVEKGYGPLRIRHTLCQKGLDDALIEKALARCGNEETQARIARRILEKKRCRLSRETDPWRRRQVAYRFLAGRGFEAPVINRAIADI
jgi:regulatory protein